MKKPSFLQSYIKLIRPNQWVKNFLIFAPLVFSINLFSSALFLNTLWVFLLFCGLASGVYIMNDMFDLERDRNHPKKKERPLASGAISKMEGGVMAVLHFAITLSLMFMLSINVGWVGVAYLVLNIFYSSWLKHVPIVDLFAVTSNYVLRLLAGVFIVNVSPTKWILIAGTLIALFLVLGKRRHELMILGEEAAHHRGILKEYSTYLLDQMMIMVSSSLLVVYCLYTFDPAAIELLGTPYMPLTIPFVLYGIFRYFYLVHQKKVGGDPSRDIIQDKPLLLNIFLWGSLLIFLIYLQPTL